MKHLFIISLVLITLIFSCSNDIEISKPVSINDGKDLIKAKLQKTASLDKQEFGEISLFDEYYNSEITQFYMKDADDEQRNLTVGIHDNQIRYMKMLMQHVGNTSTKNINSHQKKYTTILQKMIDEEAYKRTGDGKYMTVKENSETWNVVWLITQNEKSKVQDYWTIMTPENELDYLKYMVQMLKNKPSIKTTIM